MNDGSMAALTARQNRGAKRRARTHAELLTAARKVFAQRGYYDASILDITAAADMGVGTFYLHFKDKDDAFNTLIDEVLQALEEKIVLEVHQQGAISLQGVIRSIFLNAYENRDLYRIALNRSSNVKRYLDIEDMMAKGIQRAFDQLGDASVFGAQNTYLLARLTTGMIAQGIAWWFDSDVPGPEQMAAQVISLLEHGLPATLFHTHPLESSTQADE
jgi:AcrR family transcriptional regulator